MSDDSPLAADVRERLGRDRDLGDAPRQLLLELLDERAGVDAGSAKAGPTSAGGRVFLRSIEVTGFRGIGPTATLDLAPGPGLTLVAGRNGAGKSSFADGFEYLLTGQSYRWRGKSSTIWRTGWANLHHGGDRSVAVDLLREGATDGVTVRRDWSPEDGIDDGVTTVTTGEEQLSFDDLGWTEALDLYRPFLPHEEMESMLSEGPSHLFDALAGILGLGELTDLSSQLADRRKALQTQQKTVKDQLGSLLVQLQGSDDHRAAICARALGGRTWDLDAVERELSGVADSADPTSQISRARQLMNVAVPTAVQVEATVEEFETARAAAAMWVGTDADRSLQTAALLEKAVAFHDHVGDHACPVCGHGTLDESWHDAALEQIHDLRDQARAAAAAHRRLKDARASLVALTRTPDALVSSASVWPVDVRDLRDAFEQLAAAEGADDAALGELVRARATRVAGAASSVAASAGSWIASHEDNWRPIAEPLTAWLIDARTVADAKMRLDAYKAAEKWLTGVIDAMRVERFRPIRDQAKALFATMKSSSNVSLEGLDLVGRSTRRRLELEVSVDDRKGASVAVMSQGELNTLALALFLPRAMLEPSPFGFVVIDDPVQAMDPSRVDGLARVLQKVAKQRQVVVFTHDDRLPDAVRNLGIEATILQVQRRKNSEIEVRPVHDPAKQYLTDANFLRRTDMPEKAKQAVVPVLLRQSIEASCQAVVRRRRLAAGEAIAAIDEELADLETVDLVGLVLLDRTASKSDVYDAVTRRFSREWADALGQCNTGAHSGVTDLDQLCTRAGKLSRKLGELS